MKFRPLVKLLLLTIGVDQSLHAQVDTTVTSQPVEVVASHLRHHPIGSEVWTSQDRDEELFATQDLGTILSKEANVYIKSYGLGSLATTSIRGGQAGHTLILWNKIPLTSPMLGLADLALITPSEGEDLRLIKGGNSALWGSGAIDGTISIDSRKSGSQGAYIGATAGYGSFGYSHHNLALRLGRKKWESHTQWQLSRARNDFPYHPAFQLPVLKQEHAKFSQRQFRQDLHWQRSRSRASIHYWYSDADRQIPPTITQTASEAMQSDEAHRLTARWFYSGDNGSWQSTVGYASEFQRFEDPLAGIANNNQFDIILADLTYQRYLGNNREWQWGTSHTLTSAGTTAYSETVQEWRSSLFTNYKEWHSKWQWQISLREDLIDGAYSPLTPLVGVEVFLSQLWTIKGKISRNFRHPTLNHRYWRPGGNQDLEPEQGWEQEFTVRMNPSSTFKTGFSLTAFNRTVKNWILWRPEAGQNYWAPENIARVWSRGVDFRVDHHWHAGEAKGNFSLSYQLTKSTNQTSLSIPKINAGDQLIYTPLHLATTKINIDWRSIHFYYLQKYTGSTQGVNEAIRDFTVADIGITYQSTLKRHKYRLYFNLKNIWNTNYFIIERRPMPGINWDIGIKLDLNY